MTFLTYLLLTFTLVIKFIRSSSISSSDNGPITNKSIIELSKHRSKRYSPDFEDRIIGGQFVKDFNKYPFMVFVHRRSSHVPSGFYGGTLISKMHVLTAAHCLEKCHCNTPKDDHYCFNCTKFKTEDFTLHFGNIVPANSKMTRTLRKVYVHSEFKSKKITHKCRGRFDIAVLELSTPVPFGQGIATIKLPKAVTLYKDDLISTMTSSFFDKKKKCTILGWGVTGVTNARVSMTRRLKVASVPLIGHVRCIKFIFNYKKLHGIYKPGEEKLFPTANLCTDTSVCSKCPQNRNGFCHGDSGGPIICGGVQVGVASHHIGDCVALNIYTRVDINVQWINSMMSNKHDRMHHEY